MHTWGDGFPWFEEVGRAADEIGDFCRRWGRIRVSCTKEKFGTSRVYCSLGCYQLGELIFPGHAYVRGWKILRMVYVPNWVNDLLIPYQSFIYRLAYRRAVEKYPHIREAILCVADYRELLEGL